MEEFDQINNFFNESWIDILYVNETPFAPNRTDLLSINSAAMHVVQGYS